MLRSGLAMATVAAVALSSACAAEQAKGEPGRLAGVWVCKSLDTDGQTVIASELRFADGRMEWSHPTLDLGKKVNPRGTLELAFGVSGDGRLFGVVLKSVSEFAPKEGETFSGRVSVDGDELVIRDVKSSEGKSWGLLQGVYRKRP